MNRTTSRAVRWTTALTLTALAACADEPTSTTPRPPLAPSLVAAGDDVVIVTSASGGNGVGTLRWAAATVKGYGTIRFDSSLAGATIALDSTVYVRWSSVTIEGPKPRGITLSGRDQMRVLHLDEFGYMRNVSITRGSHPVAGGGIYAPRGVLLEHGTVSYNSAPTGGGIYGGSVGLINSTVAYNTSTTGGSGVSYTAPSAGISLYNSTVARNGPAPGIEGRGNAGLNGLVILNNSIIASNGAPGYNCVNLQNVSYEGTIISNDATCGGFDKVFITDPMLGSLADRGGPGATIDFARESPALNGGAPIQPTPGTSCFVYWDERWVPRDNLCDVGAFEFTDFTKVTLTIDAGATVDATTGNAVVTGKMTCTHNGGQLGVVVELEQQKGGKTPTLVWGAGGAGVTCSTATQAWSVTVTPETGAFENGSAAARARTNDMPQWIKPATTSTTVRLSRPRR